MFDNIERKKIEKLGLNCLFIDEENQNKRCIDLDYIDSDDIFLKNNISFQNSTLLPEINTFKSFGINSIDLPMLIVSPEYWDDIYIEIINKYSVKNLILSAKLTTFLKKPTREKKLLTNLSFLKSTSPLTQFYLQPQKGFFIDDIWDIYDFKPLEYLRELEYLSISNNETLVDIDFSKLTKLKEVNLQTVEKNRTLYECYDLERINSRYYEKDFLLLSKLEKLMHVSLYLDNAVNFIGINKLINLKEIHLEVTTKLKSFEGLSNKSIEIFWLYSDKCNAKTLDGIGGLVNTKQILLAGLKKLDSIGDLKNCKSVIELEFQKCTLPDDIISVKELYNLEIFKLLKCRGVFSLSFLSKIENLKEIHIEGTIIPDDISDICLLKNLESLTLIDCKEIQSLEFVTSLENLKYLNFAGTTKILDGNLDYLDILKVRGVSISFDNRKHYSRKIKDVNPELQQMLDEVSG